MVRVGGVAAAVLLAAAFFNIESSAAGETGQSDRDLQRFLLFSGSDLWRNGGFAHAGALWSPDGVDRAGFALKAMLGGGAYRYRSGALGGADVTGQLMSAAILPGWRFIRDKLITTVFVGIDFQNHRLFPDDPSAGLRGSYVGLRTGIELWYEPSATTMISADATVSTIGPSYFAKAAYGWRALDAFYVGPEVAGFASDGNYRQIRAGVHVTGFKAGAFEWSGGLGWVRDSDAHSGVYGRFGLIARP